MFLVRSNHRQANFRGIAMLEVLVAISILAISVMTLSRGQLGLLRNYQDLRRNRNELISKREARDILQARAQKGVLRSVDEIQLNSLKVPLIASCREKRANSFEQALRYYTCELRNAQKATPLIKAYDVIELWSH